MNMNKIDMVDSGKYSIENLIQNSLQFLWEKTLLAASCKNNNKNKLIIHILGSQGKNYT